MKNKVLFCSLAASVAVLVAGCVGTLDGRHQAGMPFVKDKFESRYERPVLECWAAAKDVLNQNGQLYSEDHLKSTLEGNVNERTIWVKVEPVDQRFTRVAVQARGKGGGTDLDLAREIDKQIGIRLATGNLSPSAAGPRNN